MRMEFSWTLFVELFSSTALVYLVNTARLRCDSPTSALRGSDQLRPEGTARGVCAAALLSLPSRFSGTWLAGYQAFKSFSRHSFVPFSASCHRFYFYLDSLCKSASRFSFFLSTLFLHYLPYFTLSFYLSVCLSQSVCISFFFSTPLSSPLIPHQPLLFSFSISKSLSIITFFLLP